MTTADPDRPCPHPDFVVLAEVARLTASDTDDTVIGFSASLRVHCSVCDEPFRWIGAAPGLLPDRPCASIDESELRAPIRPASSDPDFGLGLSGFTVRVHP